MKWFPLEERIYRLRCVEAWSMVIPWIGFPLGDFVKRMEPTAKAKYIEFRTLVDMQADAGADRAGAAVAVSRGPAHGRGDAPAGHPRPWASTARCCRTRTARRSAWWCRGSTASRASSRSCRCGSRRSEPLNTWQQTRAGEYGFYANVNPDVDHPRWTQAVGAADRRVLPPQDAAVQRLWRPGGVALRRHGPAALLTDGSARVDPAA